MDFLNNLKAIVSVLGTVIIIINVIKWRDFEFNKPFNNFSKRSLFAYELFAKTGRKKFERLGYDFGVIAFLGNTNLKPSQRDRVLEVSDPVRAIESFKKCRRFVEVNEKGISLFEWKTKRYRNVAYRKFLKTICIAIYFVFIMTIPMLVVYLINFESELVTKLIKGMDAKLFIALCLVTGEFLIIGFLALSKASSIAAAERLIKENMQASDMILTHLSN
ncbi:hypothetical protein LCD46_06750 [Enterobacter ludwigii]|uniref:hypothetical protein n=1 Tax=unclassified Enterobacter TaxID=2608935 RepID=UPI001ABE7E2F|nr:hypothetical protein [Enterobacter ludwigii]UOY72010.1 hypothetical protein LCD46_06750 [Enterobacter ludwigii]